jgi:hypothetical protein
VGEELGSDNATSWSDGATPGSVIGQRLAACEDEPVSWTALGLEDAWRVAAGWQNRRANLDWTMFATVVSRRTELLDWVQEIHGLIGIVGEQLIVAIEAEVEKDALSRVVDASGRQDGETLSRFFAECHGNALVIAVTSSPTLVLRTCALHPQFIAGPVARSIGLEPSTLRPRSMTDGAWILFNWLTASNRH